MVLGSGHGRSIGLTVEERINNWPQLIADEIIFLCHVFLQDGTYTVYWKVVAVIQTHAEYGNNVN